MEQDGSDPTAFSAPVAGHEERGLLRFLTCGSVDDGKSTLIRRLLYDTKTPVEDQPGCLPRGASGSENAATDFDFAPLVDGIAAECEQALPIDVAYRSFATAKRSFIAADTPGHEQYTRSIATGALNADLAIILVDARKGILPQTRRLSYIASLLGIRHAVLAINKIDLVGYSKDVLETLVQDYRSISDRLAFTDVTAIPISARFGDNVARRGHRLDWYQGPPLLDHLETVDVHAEDTERPFRMPVQRADRNNSDFRGYCGTVASGRIHVGDCVVATGGATSTVRSIITSNSERNSARAGDTSTLVLSDDIDISSGDTLSATTARPEIADQLSAQIIWMAPESLVPGRLYRFKIAGRSVVGSVTEIRHLVDVHSFQHLAANSLALNDIALVNLSLREPIAFDSYEENKLTSSFTVVDRVNDVTVGAGMIAFALRRASNIHWQSTELSKKVRSEALGQRSAVVWFTGLSGSGKSTLANLLERRLFALGFHTYLIDGDNIRHGLNRDLGFTEAARVENIRRVAEVARLFVDAGIIVLVSLISPFRSERKMARELFEPGEFIEAFVDTPIEVAEKRDTKGLYKKARAGAIKNFTGIDSPYEPPQNPELRLAASLSTPEFLVEGILDYLKDNKVIRY